MSTREDVVAVLDGLVVDLDDGTATIVASQRIPDQPQAFTAWPVWAFTTWRTRCVDESQWSVLVALPGGVPDAWAANGDAVMGPVRDALSKIGGVMRCEPVAIPYGDGGQVIPALSFTLVT